MSEEKKPKDLQEEEATKAEIKRMQEYSMPSWVTRVSSKLRGVNYARKDRNRKEITLEDVENMERGQH